MSMMGRSNFRARHAEELRRIRKQRDEIARQRDKVRAALTEARAERDRMHTAYAATNEAYRQAKRHAENEQARAERAERERGSGATSPTLAHIYICPSGCRYAPAYLGDPAKHKPGCHRCGAELVEHRVVLASAEKVPYA